MYCKLYPKMQRSVDPRDSVGAATRKASSAPVAGDPWSPEIVAEIRTLVLVEGDSDAGAVRTLAAILGCDLGLRRIKICSAGGVTNFSQSLAGFVRTHPNAQFCGMYDVAEQRHVRRALASASVAIAADESLERFGFFACVADLEEELIR